MGREFLAGDAMTHERYIGVGCVSFALLSTGALLTTPVRQATIVEMHTKTLSWFLVSTVCVVSLNCGKDKGGTSESRMVAKAVTQGDMRTARSICSHGIESYSVEPRFRAACDTAFTAVFAKMDTFGERELRLEDELASFCIKHADTVTWRDASNVVAKGCDSYAEKLKAEITTRRNTGKYWAVIECSLYKDFVKVHKPNEFEKATLLCMEAQVADEMRVLEAEVDKMADVAEAEISINCNITLGTPGESSLDNFKDSQWFATRSKEHAKHCYAGPLAIRVLQGVKTDCGYVAKAVHQYAAQYNLAADNAELKALLDKTAKICAGPNP